MESAERLRVLATLLAEVRDVLVERVHTPAPPAWCERRGWTSFLLSLDEATLERCEHGDIAQRLAVMEDAPASLRALAREVLAVTRLPSLGGSAEMKALRRAGVRKRQQVAALGALTQRWAPRVRRVVDVGAGHGHLTRELALRLGVAALGVESREHVVSNARALTESDTVCFVRRDAIAEPLKVRSDDLVVGLHACGALGDAIVERAAEADAGVLLVSCCPQKIDGDVRPPLSAVGRSLGLSLPRPLLGLANLATLTQGGKDSANVMERHRTRYTLFLLLREAGVQLAPGDEMAGIPRRRLGGPFDALLARAFDLRALPLPSAAAIARARERAQREHAAIRRLALPRTMFARVLELALVYDRAAHLDEHSNRPARVRLAFDRQASPRNIAILRDPA